MIICLCVYFCLFVFDCALFTFEKMAYKHLQTVCCGQDKHQLEFNSCMLTCHSPSSHCYTKTVCKYTRLERVAKGKSKSAMGDYCAHNVTQAAPLQISPKISPNPLRPPAP